MSAVSFQMHVVSVSDISMFTYLFLAAIIPVSSRLLAKSPEKMTVLRGETLILECLSQGSPVPVITWDKHGSFIPDKRAEFRLGGYWIALISFVGKLPNGSLIQKQNLDAI